MQLTALAMKYYYGFDHYGEKDKIINTGTSADESPRHSETETWGYVVQCRSIVRMRVEFIFQLCENIKRL